MSLIPFAKFMPDTPDHKMGSSQYSKNVIPRGGYWTPFKDLSTVTDALTARCQGAFAAADVNGDIQFFAGDITKLYKLLSGAAWDDVTGVTYSVPAEEKWEFSQYGLRILATNIDDPIQSYVMGTSTDFAALGGSPPQARHIGVIRDFVVLGNVATAPSRVQWCDIDDPTDWSTGLSDYQDLPNGGWVQGIVGGENGLIFCETSIYRMLYGGDASIVFQFDEAERNRGLYVPGSLCHLGQRVFYLSSDGFYMCSTNGGDSVPIGARRVDRWFFDNAEETDYFRMTSTIDPRNKLVMWSFRSVDALTSNPDKILVYNWEADEWAVVDNVLEYLFGSRSVGVTLDNLDSISSSLDALAFSLDSRAWTPGALSLAAFNADHKLGNFSGSNLEATLETMESDISEGRRSTVTAVKPVADTASSVVKIGYKERAGDTVAYGSEASQRTSGDCPVRVSGRYLRGRMRIPAATTWTTAQGLEVVAHDDGER